MFPAPMCQPFPEPRRAWVPGIVLVALLGCGGAARSTMGMPELSRATGWKKLQEPARGLSRAITEGVLDGLSAPERDRVMGELLDRYVTRFVHVMARELGTTLGPAMTREVRASVAAALDEMLAEPVLHEATAFVERTTRAAVLAFGRAAAEELTGDLGPAAAQVLTADLGPAAAQVLEQHLGPALQTMIEQHLGPALQTMIEQHLGPALRHVIASDLAPELGELFAAEVSPATLASIERMAEAATRGVSRGVREELERHESDAWSRAYPVLTLGLAGAVGVLLLVVWLRRREARRTAEALALVVRQIHGMDHHPEVRRELAERIRSAGAGTAGGLALAGFLDEHREYQISWQPRD